MRCSLLFLPRVRCSICGRQAKPTADTLLEDLAVGVLVRQRRAEGLDLAGVIAAPYAEYNPPAGVGGRKTATG
jgi:hypothetical protein